MSDVSVGSTIANGDPDSSDYSFVVAVVVDHCLILLVVVAC